MLSDLLMWNKIGRIVTRLSERLGISISKALEVFYTSSVCRDLHDPETELYLYGDNYIVDEIVMRMRK